MEPNPESLDFWDASLAPTVLSRARCQLYRKRNKGPDASLTRKLLPLEEATQNRGNTKWSSAMTFYETKTWQQ